MSFPCNRPFKQTGRGRVIFLRGLPRAKKQVFISQAHDHRRLLIGCAALDNIDAGNPAVIDFEPLAKELVTASRMVGQPLTPCLGHTAPCIGRAFNGIPRHASIEKCSTIVFKHGLQPSSSNVQHEPVACRMRQCPGQIFSPVDCSRPLGNRLLVQLPNGS